MLLKIVCLLMRWSFSLAVLVVRGDRAKSAELLVLRHENACCAGTPAGSGYDSGDRAWFAALTRFILCVPRIPSAALISRFARPALRPR